MITAKRLIKLLNLQPHPEGGYYAETYRSNELIPKEALLERYAGPRSYGTAIYYLLTPQTFSAIHRLATDEIYHFYLGDPVVLILLQQDGSGRLVTLGSDVASGMQLQTVVSRGTWQGAKLVDGGKYALLGTTVAPSFDFADFEVGRRSDLIPSYPAFRDAIIAMTRGQ
jgi:uncharacterized protein